MSIEDPSALDDAMNAIKEEILKDLANSILNLYSANEVSKDPISSVITHN